MKVERAPGAALIHPLAIASWIVLVLNDHVVKRHAPGVLSGKLSDFAGVLLLPLFLHALFELARARLRPHPEPVLANRVLFASVLVTVTGFSLVELWAPAETEYRFALGYLQWPFRAAFAWFRGDAAPGISPVLATADVTDLAATPMGVVSYFLGRRPDVRKPRARSQWLAAGTWFFALLLVASHSAPATAAERTHDGFYLAGELGAGLLFLQSTASISNGFQQSIESSASGRALPVPSVEVGGTLARQHLVLGGRFTHAKVREPTIETLGDRFILENSEYELSAFQAFGHYYPDLHDGLRFGMAFGLAMFDAVSAPSSNEQQGYVLSLDVGHGIWISKNWMLGGVARLAAGWLEGDEFGSSRFLLPTLAVALTWH
jgi:hypothetical protein